MAASWRHHLVARNACTKALAQLARAWHGYITHCSGHGRQERRGRSACAAPAKWQPGAARACSSMGMKPKASLPWSPQLSAALERAHQALGGALRALELGGKEAGPSGESPLEEHLSSAAYAARPPSHAVHGHSPGELAFGRSMLLPASAPAGWEKVRQRKQKAIARSSKRENAKKS